MARKCKTTLWKLNDKKAWLIVTNKKGQKVYRFFDLKAVHRVRGKKAHIGHRGYVMVGKLTLPEVIFWPRNKELNYVWHHIDSMIDDNSHENLRHIPSALNKVLSEPAKKTAKICRNGIFPANPKNPECKKVTVRTMNPKKSEPFDTVAEALIYRLHILMMKGATKEESRRQMELLTRAEYAEYWENQRYKKTAATYRLFR